MDNFSRPAEAFLSLLTIERSNHKRSHPRRWKRQANGQPGAIGNA